MRRPSDRRGFKSVPGPACRELLENGVMSMTDLVDLSRIQETSDGDLEFEQELIEMFIDDAAEHVKALMSAGDGDAEEVKKTAHTLKGASANSGAVAIQDFAFRIEKAAGAGDLSDLPAMAGNLKDAYDKTEVFFKNYLSTIS